MKRPRALRRLIVFLVVAAPLALAGSVQGSPREARPVLVAQESRSQYVCGSAEAKFKRISELPQGEQINALVSGLLSGFDLSNSIEVVCSAPESRVWLAAKKAAERLHEVGKRPVVGMDEKLQMIQNGRIR